jgi:protein-tyrosine phosphatase
MLTALVTSPVIMAIKRPVRDLLWTVKGASLVNPPVPAGVSSILFVCLGNICRSPFAAVLAADRLKQANELDVLCASAGIRTNQGARAPDTACDVATSYGLSLAAHRPQTLTRELVDTFDLIVVMEAAQLIELRTHYPDAADRLMLLSLFDDQAGPGYGRYNIADPFSKPRATFEACYRRVDRATSALLAAVRASRGERPAHAGRAPQPPGEPGS